MSNMFEHGVFCLAEHLLRKAVSDGHEGEVSYAEIIEAATAFGVPIDTLEREKKE